ncbi:Ribonuclease Z 1 [Cladobotryum mycophilum]|uniref:ribonuclease Z n=1 Tax=Cladobotryum mycophilum TaxID=491253 RepID=A0ABR0SDH6_9HYPO
MTTTVEVASVPSADTPGSCIFIHHDKRSYVFGRVGEGTQRAFGSRKIGMGGTEHVFLSGAVSWEQLGGLCGYLLSVGGAIESAKEFTVAENEKREKKGLKLLNKTRHAGIGVHGADNLCHTLAACRPVIFRQPICVRTHEHRTDPRAEDATNVEPDWVDDAIKVWKIPTRRARSSSPRKRRHSGEDRDGAEAPDAAEETSFKPRATLSDPDVAGSIVERIMFNGSLKNRSVLIPVKLSKLKPTDVAVIVENSVLKQYKGPYAANGVKLSNTNDTAWLFPDIGEVGKEEKADSILAINHFPLPRTTYGETSMSYIVKCHARRGKFNAPLAKSLGVQPKDFKLLTSGESAPGTNGPVTPEMILGEPQPGKGIIVADIGSHEYLDSFMERPEWKSAELMTDITVMYWILGSGLAEDARVQKFTQDHSQIKHVFCAQDTCPNMITHPGAATIQAKLRRIDPERFPILKFENTVKYPAPPAESPIELGRAGKKLQLMPRRVFDDDAMAPFPDLVEAYNSVDEEVLALAEQAKAAATDPEFLAKIENEEQDIPNRDAEIIPLGTGSSVPSKYRNVSATLIRVPGIGNYLLDCGEGTLGQISRLFGEEEAADVLRNLRCIVISHAHADHHMGTPTVIKAWYEQTLKDNSNATLAISCIGRYRVLLEELSQVEDIGFHRLRFPSCPLPREKDKDLTTREDLGEENFGLASIKRIPVPHCWRSYATQIELTSGLKIAYSGDCRPSKQFAQECEGAHLLVHECTFGDDKRDHAKAKKHSTMGEALWVAKEMKARRTLLTHFSQRYSKSDSLKRDRVEGGEHDVLLAFDFMRVKLGDFQKAACYIPAVQKLMEKLGE